MSGAACCKERLDGGTPYPPPCMNTNPNSETTEVCNRVAGHEGDHVHCPASGHRLSTWKRKEGDWSGSNLPQAAEPEEVAGEKRRPPKKAKKKKPEPEADVEAF